MNLAFTRLDQKKILSYCMLLYGIVQYVLDNICIYTASDYGIIMKITTHDGHH